MKRVGSLWVNKTKDGKTYLAGDIEIVAGITTKVVAFKNEAKDGKTLKPGSPNYVLYLSEPNKDNTKDSGLVVKNEDLL